MTNDPTDLSAALAAALGRNPWLTAIFGRWPEVALPDAYVGAGAIAQTLWNLVSGRVAESGIKDIDLVYFDAADLSAEAEARHQFRLASLFADIPVPLDVKNQARVYLWYEAKFGRAIPPYASIEDAVASWPTTATAVAVRPAASGIGGGLSICAPFGLADLMAGVVRPNRRLITRDIYEAKLARWRRQWPALDYRPWPAATDGRGSRR